MDIEYVAFLAIDLFVFFLNFFSRLRLYKDFISTKLNFKFSATL